MKNQMQNDSEIQNEPGFWDDNINVVIVGFLILLALYLMVKFQPWEALFSENEIVSGASSAVSASAGLSVSEMVQML